MRNSLAQEFSSFGRRKTSDLDLRMETLDAQNASMKEQLSIVQQERVQHDQSLSEGLLASLEDTKIELASYRKQNRYLTNRLEEESEARKNLEAQVERLKEGNKRLRTTLDDQLHQTELLNSVVKGSTKSDVRDQIMTAIEEADKARRERDEALDQVRDYEKALAVKSSAEVAQLSMHETSMREEIRDLNEQRTRTMKAQIEEYEADRDRLEVEVAGHLLKFEQAEIQIDNLSRSHGIATAQREELERERDAALAQIKLLKEQVKEARFEVSARRATDDSDRESRSSSRYSRAGDTDIEDALEQRDRAVSQYHTLLRKLSRGQGVGVEQVSHLKSELETAIEQRRHAQRDLQLALDRGSHVELAAAKTIKSLQADLAEALQQSPVRGDFRSEQTLQLIRSKQFEAELQKAAANELRRFAEQEAEVNKNRVAARTLAKSDISYFDNLPRNWESMVSPEGMEYYVDHSQKVTTWLHPNYNGGSITLFDEGNASPTPQSHSRTPILTSNPAFNTEQRQSISRTSSINSENHTIHPDHEVFSAKLGALRKRSSKPNRTPMGTSNETRRPLVATQ